MVNVKLPDGSVRSFDHPVTVAEIAASIGPGLAKAALAGRVNGKLVDTAQRVESDSEVAIVTDKDPDGLDIIRHSSAHLLAHAVKELFPDAQVTIGPVIEDGFYYDFAYKRPFTPEDLAAIEKRMAEIAKRDIKVERKLMPRDEAVKFFSDMGEKYKAEIISSIPQGEQISLYGQGNFIDLCRGPHVPSTGKLKVNKLMKVAGAYWRGDSKNEMLQRIYGTAWAKKKTRTPICTASKRRRSAITASSAARSIFSTCRTKRRGWCSGIRRAGPSGSRSSSMRGVYGDSGFQEVRCPQILDVSLWQRSGHWDNFRENMFFTASENREYAVKPMNCPGHVQIFNSGLRSYRDLPLRYGEFGSCHRNEPSGALHGIMRLRAFTQDDGHIFCTPAHIQSEVEAFHRRALEVYGDFGFTDINIKLALRPPKRLGGDEVWDQAENALRDALRKCGVEWQELPGEGAFYGPKIEYHLKDSIGRPWQCGTIQVDFMMPGRLGAEYVDDDNTRKAPVMLHRAIVGSMERFIGILIEHYAGAMPVWLAPVQAVVMNISEHQMDYARDLAAALRNAGVRAAADLRNEKISYKIREHSLQKLPYQIVVGDKEVAAQQVAVRTRTGEDLGRMTVEAFLSRLKADEAQKGRSA